MNDDSRISENLADLRGRIADAARRSGRTAEDVKLVAVTKYVDADVARQLVQTGCHDLGEARPQELWRKADALAAEAVAWHLIGHLQRNKIARTLRLAHLIHSGDSMRLLNAIDAEAAQAALAPVPILLEVNISGDATKHGFKADELPSLGAQFAALANIEIRGMMCMAGREGDLDAARRDFESLRLLRDQLRLLWSNRLDLDELSMGMSGDYEVAIEEGATIVRIGSALFAGVASQ